MVIRKTYRKTNFSDEKQYRKNKHQKDKNNQKTKMWRKKIVKIFLVINKRNLTREELDMAKKG